MTKTLQQLLDPAPRVETGLKQPRRRGTYQGHRSWNAWNVALWIANDEPLYRAAVSCLRHAYTLSGAVEQFFIDTGLQGEKTPDGAIYNKTCVREALAKLEIRRA